MYHCDYNSTAILDQTHLQNLSSRYPMEGLGNPSSLHRLGQKGAFIREQTRRKLAHIFQTRSEKIFFTSGATESNHLGILGFLNPVRTDWSDIEVACSLFEHASIREQMKFLAEQGARIHWFDPRTLDFDSLPEKYPHIQLIICLSHHHETGWGFPLVEWGCKLQHKRASTDPSSFWNRVQWHIDASQSFGKTPLSSWFHPAFDSWSLSAHKIGALGGLGVLLILSTIPRYPLFRGGGQEKGLRSGTENLLALLSLQIILDELDFEKEYKETRQIMIDFEEKLRQTNLFWINSDVANPMNLPNTVHISLKPECPIKAQDLIIFCDLEGYAIGSGSACASGLQRTSENLLQIWQDPIRATETIRISVNPRLDPFSLKEIIEGLYQTIIKGCQL